MKIDDILEDIETRIEPFALCGLRHNATLDLERTHSGLLHYVLSGEGHLRLHHGKLLELREGMLVLVPSAKQHVLHGGPHRCQNLPNCLPLDLELAQLPEPGALRQDINLFVLCAYVDLALHGFHNVLYGITDPIVLDTRTNPVTATLMPLLIKELAAPGVGSKSTIKHLVSIAFIQLLQSSADGENGQKHNWEILKEPKLLPAVQAIIEDPQSKHSVESLASAAAMSRSAFAQKFRTVYGVGPMEFVRQMRLESAARLMVNPSVSIERISYEVGFNSRSAFSRAFRSFYHCTPQEFRDRLKGGAGQHTGMH